MEHGNWATHIGRQPGGRRIEAQQYRVGRPWSGWVGLNVVDNQREINLTRIEHRYGPWMQVDGYMRFDGTGEPGAHIHIAAPFDLHTTVDGAGNWSIWQGIPLSQANEYVDKLISGIKIIQTKNGQIKERYFGNNYIDEIIYVVPENW